MRIIEPAYRRPQKRRNTKKIIVAVAFISVFGAWIFVQQRPRQSPASSGVVLADQKKEDQRVSAPQKETYKQFTGDDFKSLYESLAYPNTQRLSLPPSITGNEAADNRIRTIALSRGYVLRSVPVAPIEKSNEPGLSPDDLLQQKALAAWIELKNAAQAAGIPIKLNSGYRSIEMQRQLFLSRLRATNATVAQVATGQADNQVVEVLARAAIPGYSRHHTGYTIDLLCGTAVQAFETTTCFKWLSQDNYLNAKKYGWIPSYPENTNNQGPEPESWEYVWVGKQAVLKD